MDVNAAISLMATVREADSEMIGLAGYIQLAFGFREARIKALASFLYA